MDPTRTLAKTTANISRDKVIYVIQKGIAINASMKVVSIYEDDDDAVLSAWFVIK